MQEMVIESIRLSLTSYQRMLILREKESQRYLTIWIGPSEAESISMRLHNVSPIRPLTHDLLRNLLDEFGGTVHHVLLNEISNDTYFAQIVLDLNGEQVVIDSRPSDAIALAVRAEAPIYAEESVLDKAATVLTSDEEAGIKTQESSTPVAPEELERLGAFKDFIEGLDLSDFDKPKGS